MKKTIKISKKQWTKLQEKKNEPLPKINKEQWRTAGIKAGWIKHAQVKTDVDYAMDASNEAAASPNMVFDYFSETWVDMANMTHVDLVELFKSGEFGADDKNKIRKRLQVTFASEVSQGLCKEGDSEDKSI